MVQGCKFGPRKGQQAKAKAASKPSKKKDESVAKAPSGLVPGPVPDPQPLLDPGEDGILQPPEPKGGVMPPPVGD